MLAHAAAQERSTQPRDQRPGFRTGVNYVRVDVHVTAGGSPVKNLTVGDFELLEDDTRQTIEAFELIDIRGGQPLAGREPNTVSESRDLANNPRQRVFVLYLDTYHTEVSASRRVQQPLLSLLDRMLGPDDLIGIMTPDMAPAHLTFARRTDIIAGVLSQPWGRRDDVMNKDPEEEQYKTCYPRSEYKNVAEDLIERRREQRVLDSLEGLVIHLGEVREERKAVLVVSDGWRLHRPDERLLNSGIGRTPPLTMPGVAPAGGLTGDVNRARGGGVMTPACERDRMNLSQLDTQQSMVRLMHVANRANASFYPIDPRGLAASDTSMAETRVSPTRVTQPITPVEDQARLGERITSLRTLADGTDGLAVIGSNNMGPGLTRIAEDVSAYYLLGYSSTNTKPDGRFRSIKVRVKREGVEVRARRGYRAATEAELRTESSAAGNAGGDAGATEVERAIAALGPMRAGLPLRSVAGWAAPTSADAKGLHIWFVTELDAQTRRLPEWQGGARADITVTTAAGAAGATTAATMTSTVALPAGERTVTWTSETPVAAGDYTIRVRVTSAAGGLPYADVQRVTVPATPPPVGRPRVLRGLGRNFSITADLRFRRTERCRFEWPVSIALSNLRGELLDRTGKATPIPVTVVERSDNTAGRWIAADASIAPLATGDYVVRVRGDEGGKVHEGVAAFRIVP